MSRDRWLAGNALTPSRGEGPFELRGDAASSRKQGEIESTLTAVYPDARFNFSDRVDAWGLAGLGTGKGTIELQPQNTNPDITHAMSLGDAWSLLGSGGGSFIVAGALGLVRRTFAMKAQSAEELEFRRLVLGTAALAAVLGAALFMLSLARWQTDLVPATALAIAAALGLVTLATAWRAVLRLASYLEPPARPEGESRDGDGEHGGE